MPEPALTAFLSVLDRLIRWSEHRTERRRLHYDEFVRPLIEDTEKVVDDYRRVLGELLDRLRNDSIPLEDTVDWLMKCRGPLRAVRDRLRTQINDARPASSPDEEALRRGVEGVLCGGLSLIDSGDLPTSFGDFAPGAPHAGAAFASRAIVIHHTLLDLLTRGTPGNARKVYDRASLVYCANKQLAAVDNAWTLALDAWQRMRHAAFD